MHQQNGDLLEAKASLRQALKETRCWPAAWPLDLAKSPAGVILPARRQRADIAAELQGTLQIAIQANLDLGGVASTAADNVEAVRIALRGLALAKRTGDPDQLALAYARFVLRLASTRADW